MELPNDDTIRDHYKSEFHRYNIKRKLVGLPPVTTDQFSQKKAQLLAESSQSERDQLIKCELCSKTFASKGTYKQHLESRKHKDTLKKFNRNDREVFEEENKRDDTSSTTAQDPAVCLFCNLKSADVDENLVHMRLTHSFFVSEFKHLKDLRGLLRFLGTKVHRKGRCIYCDFSSNTEARSGEAVQRHMLDKGHVFMNTEDFGEYERFYDFSKVLEDFRKHKLTVENQVVMEADEYMEIDMGNDEEEERENEDDDDWEIIDEEPNKEKKYRLKKAKLLDSGEIQLPNGNILGHRRYKHVYKQYYKDPARQNQLEDSAFLEYGDDKVIAARQEEARVMALHQEIERKERSIVEAQAHKFHQRKDREALKQGMRANKTQHYFRRQQN